MSCLKIIENGEIYSPHYLGKKNILLCGDKIGEIGEFTSEDIKGIELDKIDGKGKFVVPGFIDNHVHICGGGGEGGFRTRTPEISFTDIVRGGVTSLVGVLGTDGTGRTMTNIIAKARGLIEEGLSAWVLTGSYEVPVRTATGSICDDIMMIDRIIGTGEIAISDHRSSHPTLDQLKALISESRRGGILSGKSGIVNLHLGDGHDTLNMVFDLLETSEIPMSQLMPTHLNRNSYLLDHALKYAQKGGYVDFTTSISEELFPDKAVSSAKAIKLMLDNGVSIDQISLSSDGQGSLPQFDERGQMTGLTIASLDSLYESVKEAHKTWGIDFSDLLKTITSNPADRYNLPNKGYIKKTFDADLLLIDKESLQIDTVIARGQILFQNGVRLVKGTFEI